VVPAVLNAFYSEAFQQVRSSGCIWQGTYQCSRPTRFRAYRMRIHLLRRRNWFLVTNPLFIERPQKKLAQADPKRYVDSSGLINMSIHCRCSRRVDMPGQWDFVPAYLRLRGRASLELTHGFCPTCHAYFYPNLLGEREGRGIA
jgi:hypothetical protein